MDEEAEGLRDKFLSEYGGKGKKRGIFYYCDITFSCHAHAMLSSESDEVDERDVKRVRVRPSYVKKFLIQKLGDEDAAYEMMVCII